jgi:hypothetical protein
MKPRRPIHPIAVAQRQRGVAQAHGFGDEVFRLRSPFEKAEARGGMEFEVHEELCKPETEDWLNWKRENDSKHPR